jgi:hypothetical protein
MAQGRCRDRRREAQWRQWIARQRRSGLSIRAFCRQHQLRETAFYFWRGELARRQAEAGPRPAAGPATPGPGLRGGPGSGAAGRAGGPSFVAVQLAGGAAGPGR